MRKRFTIAGLILILYSALVLIMDSVVLPSYGIDGFAQVTSRNIQSLGSLGADAVSSAAGKGAGFQAHNQPAGVFRLWLRPFGVHRRGLGNIWWILGSFAVLSIISLILLFVFPQRVRHISEQMRAGPLLLQAMNVALGLLGYGLAFALLRLSWLTIVGLPFIPFLVGGVWLATVLGIVSVSFTAGRLISRRIGLPLPVVAEALLGLWLLFVTSMIPYLGWVTGAVAAAAGFGALLQTRFGSPRGWSLAALEEPEEESQSSEGKVVRLYRAR